MHGLLTSTLGREVHEKTVRNYTAFALKFCESTTDNAVYKTDARSDEDNPSAFYQAYPSKKRGKY